MKKTSAVEHGLSHEARAALMAFAANTLNGLVVFGVYHMSGEQLATADAWLSSFIVFIGYLSATRHERQQNRPPPTDNNDGSQT